MKTATTRSSRRPLRRLVVGAAAIGAVIALSSAPLTQAAFSDSTFATAALDSQPLPPTPPVLNDQTGGSALFIDKFGRLFVSGMRNYGDGAGGTPSDTSSPNQVDVGDAVIVDAAGSSNDFSSSQATGFMALDTLGQVWTWGRPYNTVNNLGRGNITTAQSYTAGLVTATAKANTNDPDVPLPAIIDMERAENQFYALDDAGTMWTWGYDGENLPRSSATFTNDLPAPSNTVTTISAGNTSSCTNASATSQVIWHTIWGGNNGAGGVATNGLLYTWGYDNPSTVTNTASTTQRCPLLNEAANRAIFQAYPQYYVDADGVPYDRAVQTTAADRAAQYGKVVANMQTQTLDVCGAPLGKLIVDDTECPVRQFGFSARAPRLLLQNGDLYTWRITSASYGTPFLGRARTDNSTANWDVDGNVYHPTVVLTDVDYVSAGVSSLTALTRSGIAYGWGSNNYCQAAGIRTSGTNACSTNVGADEVVTPTPIVDIPSDAIIGRLGATQCATWAEATDGRMWAWGGGTITGSNFSSCTTGSGYKIYDTRAATQTLPFGAPVTGNSTGTIQVR